MAKVLIIDDELSLMPALFAALRSNGFEVVRGSESATAMSLVQSERPDFVLVNLMMPGINGIALCRLIREQFPTVRVVLTSAYALSEPQLLRADCGAVGFIQKPYDAGTLVQFLHSELHEGPRSSATGRATRLHSTA